MKIENLKDFEKLVKLCRRLGVDTIEADGIKFQLGPEPRPKRSIDVFPEDPLATAKIEVPKFEKHDILPTPQNQTQAIADKIATDGLTEEQLMYYSVLPEAGTSQQ